MNTCRKCGKEFPNWLKINGQEKNISSRRYCLECSPFGTHNTVKLEVAERVGERLERKCPRCSRTLPITEFYNRRNQEGTSVYCKPCSNDQTVVRQRDFKRKCIEYKGGKCSKCGYKRSQNSLEFHHVDRSEKEFSISHKKLTSFDDRVTKELDKCILLCKNCHGELHEREGGWAEKEQKEKREEARLGQLLLSF